ncbi:MAG: hypothetical protein NUW37_18595 [Planctomycetes bacterium]|nr:hypothetical protein [Planctomycetota bacterium]
MSATPSAPQSNPPQAPTLQTPTVADGQIVLSWNSITNATSYNLYYGIVSGVDKMNGSKIAGVSSPYVHSGLTNGQNYYFILTAVNSAGESNDSNEVTGAPQVATTPPGSPTLSAPVPGDSQITLSWSAVPNTVSYSLYFGTSPGITSSSTLLANVNSPYMHSGLVNGTTLFYRLIASNTAGDSSLSNEVNATPQAIGSTDTTAPTGTSVVLGNVTTSSLIANWSGSVDETTAAGALTFNIYVETSDFTTTSNLTPMYSSVAVLSSKNVSGLLPNTAYFIAVTAVDQSGNEESITGNNKSSAVTLPANSDTWSHTFQLSARRSFDNTAGRSTSIWTGGNGSQSWHNNMIIWGGLCGGTTTKTGVIFDENGNIYREISTVSSPTDRNSHTIICTGSKVIIWGGYEKPTSSGLSTNTGGVYDISTDSWSAMSTINAPAARYGHSSVWTGSKLIIWGGTDNSSTYFNNGGIYDPGSNTWSNMSNVGAPTARTDHNAIWDGARMIIWGGSFYSGGSQRFSDGATYDIASNTWTTISSTNAPSARSAAASAWTGTTLFIWGGQDASYNALNDGGIYNPSTDTWTTISNTNAPAARMLHSIAWTGSRIIIWGGSGSGYLNNGAIYDPNTNSWTNMSITNAPSSRDSNASVWTGSKFLVYGGHDTSSYFADGAAYDLVADTWTTFSLSNEPYPAGSQTTVWTGSSLIAWGGSKGGVLYNTGAMYDLASDSWIPTSVIGAPVARSDHTAVWSGTKMIVWGGAGGGNTGGVYDPVGDSWTNTTTIQAPNSRMAHTSVWTGAKMIIWGGKTLAGTSYYASGGMYDHVNGTWSATTGSFAPTPRASHTAIWTGSKMLIWGGRDAGGDLNDGGVFDPIANSWSSMSNSGAPSRRYGYSAVWTGTKMIIWGGNDGTNVVNDGFAFDPVSNSWSTISNLSAPSARSRHLSVWTGSKIIIWGGFSGVGNNRLTTGGAYDPLSDSWSPISSIDAPDGATSAGFTQFFFTGSGTESWRNRCIFWGSDTSNYYLGAFYNP